MEKYEVLNHQIYKLLNKGSDKNYLLSLKDEMLKYISMDYDTAINTIIGEINQKVAEFLKATNAANIPYIDGISTAIHIEDKVNTYDIKVRSGHNGYGRKIDSETLFDVASVTKLYTLILTLKLVELGYFALDDTILSLDPRFNLEDFTIMDVIKMVGEIKTDGRIQDGKTIEEANQILQTAHLTSKDRKHNIYNDFGPIILSKVIETVVSKKEGKKLTYDEILNHFILKPYGFNHTQYNPTTSNLAGNGNDMQLVHDPKTRALGGVTGSAGIFVNADDLVSLAIEMYKHSIISKENLKSLGTVIFPHTEHSNKGLIGLFEKNEDFDNKWLAPIVYSDNVFTAQGFTGSVAIFDANNGIHNNILISSIKDNKAAKPDGFLDYFKQVEYFIVDKTLDLYMIKKYQEMTGNTKNLKI